MKCAGCSRTFEVGDRYIEDTASAFVGKDASSDVDSLIADIFGGSGGNVAFCEDCTQDGGHWRFKTVYGDEGA